MKTFIASIVVLVTMLLGIFLYLNYLTNVVDELMCFIEQIQQTATEKHWSDCSENIKELKKMWDKHKKVLCFFTDHGDLDEVEQALSKLQTSVQFCNVSDSLKYSAMLNVLLKRLVENEMPTTENILTINTKTHH